MTLNIDLLQLTLKQIEQNPELWDQSEWGSQTPCGTVACFAGWATLLNDPTALPPLSRYGSWCVGNNHVSVHACKVLGLTPAQADVLFASWWGLEALRAGVEKLIQTNGDVHADDLSDVMEGVQGVPEDSE